MSDPQAILDQAVEEISQLAALGKVTIFYEDSSGTFEQLAPHLVTALTERAKRTRRQFTPDDESRVTAYGLLRYANDYSTAARVVEKSVKGGGHCSQVASMLIGHSIELSLKAYLRSRGASLSDLHRVGHDLGRAYKRARKLRIDRLIDLPPDYVQCIREYGRHHLSGEFRYIRNGTTTLPNWGHMSIIAHLLTSNLRMHCLRSSYGREKAKAIDTNRGGKF